MLKFLASALLTSTLLVTMSSALAESPKSLDKAPPVYNVLAKGQALLNYIDEINSQCTPAKIGDAWRRAAARNECVISVQRRNLKELGVTEFTAFDTYAARTRRLALDADAGKHTVREYADRVDILWQNFKDDLDARQGDYDLRHSDIINYAALTNPSSPPRDPNTPIDVGAMPDAFTLLDQNARACISRAGQMNAHARSECLIAAYKSYVLDLKLRDMKLFDRLAAAERVHDSAKMTLDPQNDEPRNDHFDDLFKRFTKGILKEDEDYDARIPPYDPAAMPRAEIARDRAIKRCPAVKLGAFGAHYQCLLLADKAYIRQIKGEEWVSIGSYNDIVGATADAAEQADAGKITTAEMEHRYQAKIKQFHDGLILGMRSYRAQKAKLQLKTPSSPP